MGYLRIAEAASGVDISVHDRSLHTRLGGKFSLLGHGPKGIDSSSGNGQGHGRERGIILAVAPRCRHPG